VRLPLLFHRILSNTTLTGFANKNAQRAVYQPDRFFWQRRRDFDLRKLWTPKPTQSSKESRPPPPSSAARHRDNAAAARASTRSVPVGTEDMNVSRQRQPWLHRRKRQDIVQGLASPRKSIESQGNPPMMTSHSEPLPASRRIRRFMSLKGCVQRVRRGQLGKITFRSCTKWCGGTARGPGPLGFWGREVRCCPAVALLAGCHTCSCSPSPHLELVDVDSALLVDDLAPAAHGPRFVQFLKNS
jgi:hypothetical protein